MAQFNLASNPASESCRLVDFESIDVTPGIIPDTYFLTVKGTAPCLNMKVSLSPLMYVRCPDFWGIEVVGCLPQGICLTALRRYEETIPLSGITGSEGIEVVGANKRDKRKVAGGCKELIEFVKQSM